MITIQDYHNFLIEYLTIRFEMQSSNINRILITWYDVSYCYLRGILIWPSKQTASKQTVLNIMPE